MSEREEPSASQERTDQVRKELDLRDSSAGNIEQFHSSIDQPPSGSSGKFSDLFRMEGPAESILSFSVRDPEFLKNKYLESGNEVLSNLRDSDPKLPSTIENWNKLSSQQQAELINTRPPGSLDRVKEMGISVALLEKANVLKNEAMKNAAAQLRDANQLPASQLPDYVNDLFQGKESSANRDIRKFEFIAKAIFQLSSHKEACLNTAAQATQSEIEDQFKSVAAAEEQAILQLQQFVQKIEEDNPDAAQHYYHQGLLLKNSALEKEAQAFAIEYRQRANEATARASAAPKGSEDYVKNLEHADNLRSAACVYDSAVIVFNELCTAKRFDSEKEAPALEQAGEHYFQAAEAYIIGTPESLSHAENLKKAASYFSRAASEFNQLYTARCCGIEKEALAFEQAGKCYIQAAEAYAIGTPESLEHAEILNKAADCFSRAASSSSSFFLVKNLNMEKIALAFEQAAKHDLQAAEAYVIGTPESLERAETSNKAAVSCGNALSKFSHALRTRDTGNEEKALVYEKAGEYHLAQANTLKAEPQKNEIINESVLAAIDKMQEYDECADENSDTAQRERFRKAANYLHDKLEKSGWFDPDCAKQFKKSMIIAGKIAYP